MKTKRKKQLLSFLILTTVFTLFGFLVNPKASLALDSLLGQGDASFSACMNNGSCKLKHAVYIFIRASDLILGITGSLALLAFVVGGAMFLVSSGNSETVNRGKQVFIGAVIGLAIVFTSYIIINFVSVNMFGDSPGWNKAPAEVVS